MVTRFCWSLISTRSRMSGRDRALIGGAQRLLLGLWAPGPMRYCDKRGGSRGTRTNIRRAAQPPHIPNTPADLGFSVEGLRRPTTAIIAATPSTPSPTPRNGKDPGHHRHLRGGSSGRPHHQSARCCRRRRPSGGAVAHRGGTASRHRAPPPAGPPRRIRPRRYATLPLSCSLSL